MNTQQRRPILQISEHKEQSTFSFSFVDVRPLKADQVEDAVHGRQTRAGYPNEAALVRLLSHPDPGAAIPPNRSLGQLGVHWSVPSIAFHRGNASARS